MINTSKIRGSEDETLLNNRNDFYKGITARAVIQRDDESDVLVRDDSDARIALIGCDTTDVECEVFGLVITITNIYYDAEGQPDYFVVDTVGHFDPTKSEIAAAREGSKVSITSESATAEDHSSEQSNVSEPLGSIQSSTGTVVDGGRQRDRAGTSPFASGKKMRDLLGKKKP